MGLYRGGESKQRVFGKPGVYNVFCNIHPQMAAFVVVTATPYVTVAAPSSTAVSVGPAFTWETNASRRSGVVASVGVTTGASCGGTPPPIGLGSIDLREVVSEIEDEDELTGRPRIFVVAVEIYLELVTIRDDLPASLLEGDLHVLSRGRADVRP